MAKKPGYILEQSRKHGLCRASIYWRMENKCETAEEAVHYLIRQRGKVSIAQQCRDAGVHTTTVRDRMRRGKVCIEEAILLVAQGRPPVVLVDGRGYAHQFRSLTAACHFAKLPRSSVVYQMESRKRTLQEAVEYIYQRRGEEWC